VADAPDILNAFIDWIADRLSIDREATPFALWPYSFDEIKTAGGVSNIADPATLFRPIPGMRPVMTAPVGKLACQAYTRGKLSADAMARAQAIRDAMLDDDGLPAIEFAVPSAEAAQFKIFAVSDLAEPGILGRDAENRFEIVFDFAIDYARLEQAALP